MSDIKVSQLVNAATATKDDTFLVVQGNVSKKISLTTLLKYLDSGDAIRINPSQNPIPIRVSSKNRINLIYVDGVTDKIGINTSMPEELLHVVGNIKIGSSTEDGIFISSYEIISHPAGTNVINQPISILRETSGLAVYGASSYLLTNGFDGQMKYIYVKSIDTAGSVATIDVANGLGFTSISLNAIGKGISLQYISAKWVCVGNNGATLS